MDIEHLDVVLGAKVGPLMLRLSEADAQMARTDLKAREMAAGVTASMEKVSAAGAGAGMSLGRRLAATEPQMRKVGSALTRYVTAPTLLVGAAALKMGIDFQRQGLMLHTQAGASVGEMNRMEKAALNLALPQGPTQLIAGLYHLESLGLRGTGALKALKTSSVAAFMGMAPLEQTASALGGALVTGIHGTENLTRAMGLLNATVGAGNMRFEDLLGALGTGLLPAAKNVGIGLPEVGAALAVLTDRGMGAEQAATRLGMTFALLANHSGTAKKGLSDLGIGVDQLLKMTLAGHGETGLLSVLSLLRARMDQVGKVRGAKDILAVFGGGRTGKAALTLLDSLTAKTSSYQGKLRQINATADKTSADMAMVQQSNAYKISVAWSKVQSDLIKLGGALAPGATALATAVGGIATAFARLPGPIKTGLGVLVGLLAVGGPVLLGMSVLMRATETVRKLLRGLGPAAAEGESGVIASSTAETIALNGTAAAAGRVRLRLLALRALGPIAIAIALSFVPKSKKGQQALDRAGIGLMGHVPIIGPMEQQAAALGSKAGTAFDHLMGVDSSAERDVQKKRAWQVLVRQAIKRNEPLAQLQGLLSASGLASIDSGQLSKLRGAYEASIPTVKGFMPPGVTAPSRHRPTGPAPIKKFALPFALQLAAARAATTKTQADDMQAARDTVAYAKRLIDSGRLSHKALLDALSAESSAESQLWSAQTSAAKKVATAAKKAKKLADHFAVPMPMQLATARADALAALNPNLQGPTALQLKLARQEKTAAMKAINSHHLTMQAMIDAWGIVQSSNSTLASALASSSLTDTYHRVASSAIFKGLGLSHDALMLGRERYAQAAAHGGSAPSAAGVLGQPVHFHNHYHGPTYFTDPDEAHRKNAKHQRRRHATSGVRR